MHWLIHTTAGLLARVIAGALVFFCLAMIDLRKRGTHATRWREYLFLVTCVAAAIIYGVINDQITSAISWEYFYYGKELKDALGPQIPPDRAAMRWQAAKIGALATWSAGLIIGAALLIANNPRKDRPQLPYRALLLELVPIFLIAATLAVLLGWVGSRGGLNWMSEDFRLLQRENALRPSHFMATYGAHLGGYAGGLIGTVIAILHVLQKRRRI